MERVRDIRPEPPRPEAAGPERTRGARWPRPVLVTALAIVLACPFGALVTAAEAADAPGERPARGLTMGEVEARYGAPADRSTAVGQPPITRWEYPGFVVYFENDRVIHAVVTGAPPAAAPAAAEG